MIYKCSWKIAELALNNNHSLFLFQNLIVKHLAFRIFLTSMVKDFDAKSSEIFKVQMYCTIYQFVILYLLQMYFKKFGTFL